MVMFTYELPPDIRDIAQEGEFDEFDLNTFFAADGKRIMQNLCIKKRCKNGSA